jgi:hypothetical protein
MEIAAKKAKKMISHYTSVLIGERKELLTEAGSHQ